MSKLKKNNFLFIILISIVTLVILIVGAMMLYKDNSSVFLSDGYILETTTKTNSKYYFSANTKYKENVDNQITFKDNDANQVAVDPASFVHYLNGNVSFLQKGALVNLEDIQSPMVSYYNITSNNTIIKDDDLYTVTSNDKKINISSFVGRISDTKYLIAGSNLSIKVPDVADRISGEYFEILYIEEGIVKIDNQEASYQVTAQDSYVYVGDKITISLGDGKIFYDGEAKMLLSQITINNDENIDLDVADKNGVGGSGGDGSGGAGEGSGEGTGEGTGEGDGTGEDETEGALGEMEGTAGEGTGDGTGEGDGTGGSGGSGGSGVSNATASLKIELIEAKVTSTTIDLSLQMNNATMAKGNVVAYLTNVATGKREYAKSIDLVNGTFQIVKESLSPSTDYALTIVSEGVSNGTQYFQKTFTTKDLGITLEKVYATDSSLAYSVVFDENTDVTKVNVRIGGTDEEISPDSFTISKDDLNNVIVFNNGDKGLTSNTSYAVSVDTVWINNAAYSDVYTINRIDTTLKKTPKISDVNVEANADEVKFTVKLNKVEDKDKSIVSYTYNIYRADDITVENLNPEVVYSVVKSDADPLVLNLNEIDELKTGVNYRCKIIAQYNDNEMLREVSTDYSGDFLIKSKPNISFELKNSTMNLVEGTISLIDANCTVPINGRSCLNQSNKFTLRFYKLSEDETTENDQEIYFDSKSLTTDIKLDGLSSNTTYIVKVFGSYYDDEGELHGGTSGVQIGDAFYISTVKSDNLYFEIAGDNKSGYNKDGTVNSANVVNFDARLSAPPQSTVMDEIATITLNLYSGRYNSKDKLIGTYTMTDKTRIKDFFSNLTIVNGLFTDVTSKKVGKIDSIDKLIRVTNNSTGTLNGSYTIEVEDVYDDGGKNKITVENNIYTFNLTSSYYLDARIATDPDDKAEYITVTPIEKKSLTEEQYETLSKTVKNLDQLNDDTVVGLVIENSLSDIFVDSAFTYEKVVVDYVICNNATKDCDSIINRIVELGNTKGESTEEQNKINSEIETLKKQIKIISVDMGNKYQPKEQIVYLDSSEIDDGKTSFTRGYKYKIGFNLNFTTEDGLNPVYTNAALYKIQEIQRQDPVYTQYISTSDSNGITYRYRFTDVDDAIANNHFYYKVDGSDDYKSINNSLVIDGEEHEVTIPLNSNTVYSLFYARKNTNNKIDYIDISSYDFETEYVYDKKIAYTIDRESNDNVLRLILEDNDVTNRAMAYKVVIKASGNSNVSDYTRYFIASQLSSISEESGNFDDEGNPIINKRKYIAIDYANISDFIGTNMLVEVYSYYDSGLVGIDQKFYDNNLGMVWFNRTNNLYLNIYNGGSNSSSLLDTKDNADNMGIYYLKQPYTYGDSTIYLYNHLKLVEKVNGRDTIVYNPLIGATYYESRNSLGSTAGINFDLSFTKDGILLSRGEKKYSDYNPIVLNEAQLNTDDNTYKFNTIVPTVSVTTNKKNTINSIYIEMSPSGIYGNKQFIKDGKSHNKVYIDVYSDAEATAGNLIATLTSDVHIVEDSTGYTATIDPVEYTDLIPSTKYYFKVCAYIDGVYTQLYDSDESKTSYVSKTYESSTLSATSILQKIKFSVRPKDYSDDGSSLKQLTWNVTLKNTKNYKLRFELYEPDPENPDISYDENGEEIVKTGYKPVMFNGVDPTSLDTPVTCDPTKASDGFSSDGYVSGCYISVPMSNVSGINRNDNVYQFDGDDFVFGGSYYKLVVYAVPYTNNTYDYEHALLLYQNDSLTSTGVPIIINGIENDITIPFIEEPTFNIGDLSSGFSCKQYNNEGVCTDDDSYYFVSFAPSVGDNYHAIRYGKFRVNLRDVNNTIVGSGSGETCEYFLNYDSTSSNNEKLYSEDGCSIVLNVDDAQTVRFAGLKSNTMYTVEVTYDEIYRNNVSFSETQKKTVTSFSDFTYTPVARNITLGNITAGQATSKTVTLTYNGSTNLSGTITSVHYTISVKGGSSKVDGWYRIGTDNDNIFEFSSDKTARLVIDTSDSSHSDNTGFAFKSGNTYIINTQYYYEVEVEENGKKVTKEVQLVDQETGNGTYTTILNL